MGKKGIKSGAVVLKARAFTFHAKAHGGVLGFDSNLLKNFYKIRISPVVKDDETRVDVQTLARRFNLDRVSVAPNSILAFE